MILEYINAALENAKYEKIEDEVSYYGEVPGLKGVWASGKTLVGNDGNTEKTIEVAQNAVAIVIDNIVNQSLGKTIQRGYDEALKRGADIVVQIDADGLYDPGEIPEVIKSIIENNADFVLGSRVGTINMRW